MSAPIVITVPTKFIPINLAPVPIKTEIMPAPSSDADESTSSMDEFLVRGKKRRLDHLTWEEKLQRKKLKNRVAAQTSRDRKKAKMEEMEFTIQQQTDQISELQMKCDTLQSEKEAIYSKYLDLESRFEELTRRLDEQQQQQMTTTSPITIKSEPIAPVASHSVGSASTLLGSAAGIYFNGSTDDTESGRDGSEERRRKDSSPVEDNCSLPALQDMLEDFDVSKLEELAESLLADVTSELEGTDRGSSPADAQDAGTGCGMPGPMVGSPSEQLESSEETDQGSCLILTTHNYSKSPFHVEKSHSSSQQQSDSDHHDQQTVYGTYDNESNCITIVLDEDELPLQEEEIICEEPANDDDDDEHEFKVKLEPVRELLSPIPSTCSNYSEDLNKPVLEDDELRHVFKCPMTPVSFVSDGGYESLGSPTGSTDFNMTTSSFDEFWNLDLFPILNN